jgi:hypothetical protein
MADLDRQHFLVRRTEKLVNEMNRRADMLAGALGPPRGEPPPFHVKLSDEEMLQQYAALDDQKVQAIIATYGLSDYLDYSLAMQKLVSKYYPNNRPAWATYQAGTNPDVPSVQPPPEVVAAQARMGMMQPAQGQQQPEQVVAQTLASAGITPERMQEIIANAGGGRPPSGA